VNEYAIHPSPTCACSTVRVFPISPGSFPNVVSVPAARALITRARHERAHGQLSGTAVLGLNERLRVLVFIAFSAHDDAGRAAYVLPRRTLSPRPGTPKLPAIARLHHLAYRRSVQIAVVSKVNQP